MRLGYAATEYGHQGDTVDVGIALASGTTTHRGLYVATTRGRDDNRIHVITETTEQSEARDLLEAVLAHDRADLPAVAQRRQLGEADPISTRPKFPIPSWVDPWRERLVDERDRLSEIIAHQSDRQQATARALDELGPDLDAAREAWEPYAHQIRAVQARLDDELNPAMWSAHHDASRAGRGRRHLAQRRADRAGQVVADARAQMKNIHAAGRAAADRLASVEAKVGELQQLAIPHRAGLTSPERDRYYIDHVVSAVDAYSRWLGGDSISGAELTDSVAILEGVAARSRAYVPDRDEVDRAAWAQFLSPAHDMLRDRRTLERRVGPEPEIGR